MCLTNEKISEITNKNMKYKNIFSYYLYMVHCWNKCKFHDTFD